MKQVFQDEKEPAIGKEGDSQVEGTDTRRPQSRKVANVLTKQHRG